MIRTAMIDGNPLNVNTGEFTNKGIEAEVKYQILQNLSFTTNYSFWIRVTRLQELLNINSMQERLIFQGVSRSIWLFNQFLISIQTRLARSRKIIPS